MHARSRIKKTIEVIVDKNEFAVDGFEKIKNAIPPLYGKIVYK